MTLIVPTAEPTTVNAGDTVKWLKPLADYPASDGWVLNYTFINSIGKITIAASAQGADHLVNVAPDVTVNWAAGTYDWRAQASKLGETYTVATGRTVVQPAFSAETLDGRTHARKLLDAVEATLAGRATSATAEYEIGGGGNHSRKLKFIPVPELLTLRDRLRADVVREDAAAAVAAGLSPRGRIQVRFGP